MTGMRPGILKASAPLAAFVLLGITADATSAAPDPAARGLDVFVHAPTHGSPLTPLPLQIQAYGFPTVNTVAPLGSASVEAVWDPESLGPEATAVPPPVRATTDAAGRVHLDVPVPPGPARELKLLIGVRSGAHERARTITISRVRAHDVSLYVAEPWVVPGSTISAWVLVRNATTQQPAANASVDLNLVEGGVVRSAARVKTDSAGSGIARIRIPPVEEPSWRWTLRARETGSEEKDSASDEVTLFPREETPGTPRLTAQWLEASVRAGEKVKFTLRVRDASDEPVASHPIRYWIGPKGTAPPDDPKKWEQVSTLVTTDLAGEISGSADAPTTVAPVVGTHLMLVARTRVQGQDLTQSTVVQVGKPDPSLNLFPEGGSIVGGVDQRVLLRVLDERRDPVTGTFSIKADGLDVNVTTDTQGEAEFVWRAPAQVGAFRGVGPCANNVAATVVIKPQGELAAFGKRSEPYQLCLHVDRDATGLVRTSSAIARAGDKLRVQILGGGRQPWSVVLRSSEGETAASAWLPDGEQGADLLLPEGAHGFWSITAVSPGSKTPSKILESGVLVRPRVLPALQARMSGGRAAPSGKVEVEADLTDGHGNGLPGAVAAVVYDLYGGGSAEGLWSLDTRRSLCVDAGIDRERCDAFLDGDASLDPVRRGLIGNHATTSLPPAVDPGATVEETLDTAFRAVVHSLEGAVLESTESPERLRDVRRKGPGGWDFNPELWTLVTAAMSEQPMTPGGELFSLNDVIAIDRQVSFDNVARRVTRLKLFRVLMAVRTYIQQRGLGQDEPALRDPGAILRRIVRDGQLAESALVDPWGGTLQFVKGNGPGLPFLTIRGFELHAPGPDGAIGTADDVREPFERVLRSKTPYAEAVSEDRLIDARLDMQVADATVNAWESLFQELTGISLGSIGTLGHGAGTGTGQGFGSGHGRLGGSHRTSPPRVHYGATKNDTVWLPPVRTDANGHVKLTLQLGDVETTWRVALVGVPDKARPATTMMDIPVSLPLSARVDAGAFWVRGDDGAVRVTLRNRTQAPVRASVALTASGAVALSVPSDARKVVDIPARGASEFRVRVNAQRTGTGVLEVRSAMAGTPEDLVRHEWEVKPPGELTNATKVAWIEGESTLALPLDPRATQPVGAPTLVVERGHEPVLAAALDSLEPDRLRTPQALADSLDTALRIRRWAIARGGQTDPMASRSAEIARRALGRIAAYSEISREPAVWKELASRVNLAELRGVSTGLPKPAECPPQGKPTADTAVSWLELEPPPVGGVIPACWDSFITEATESVMKSADPVALARSVLALADRSHRAAVAAAMARRLEEQVRLQPTGFLELPGVASGSRWARAVVYASLLRMSVQGVKLAASTDKLAAWLLVQRDTFGGYGSTAATRGVVQALLAMTPPNAGPAKGTVIVGDTELPFELAATGTRVLALPANTDSVVVRCGGGPIIARLQRQRLRWWSLPSFEDPSPLRVDLAWPADAKAGMTSRVQVTLRHDLGRATTVDLRIPLPAGASLAAPVSGIRQVQGVLTIRRTMDASSLPTVFEIPVRFALPGRFTVPEAEARLAFEEAQRALIPARPLVVR